MRIIGRGIEIFNMKPISKGGHSHSIGYFTFLIKPLLYLGFTRGPLCFGKQSITIGSEIHSGLFIGWLVISWGEIKRHVKIK